MVSENIIKKKINAIRHCLERIQAYQDLSLEEFLNDEDTRDIVLVDVDQFLAAIIRFCRFSEVDQCP